MLRRHFYLLAAVSFMTGNSLLGNVELERYVAEFNAADEELYTNTVPNAAAMEFLAANVPVLECPDPAIERTCYFRWWTFRKHLKKTKHGWVITEFLPEVAWAGWSPPSSPRLETARSCMCLTTGWRRREPRYRTGHV